MARQAMTTISEFPIPDSLSAEIQVIADIISTPEAVRDAERIISADTFSDDKCRSAYEVLRTMARDGMIIDLPSVFGKIDRDLMQKGIVPMMQNSGGLNTANQHILALRDLSIKRTCYLKSVELLSDSVNPNVSVHDLLEGFDDMAKSMRRQMDNDRGMVHISKAIQELGENIEGLQRDRQSGKVLRTPTGFGMLNFYTYGGFNAGNLVVLAARPSVGKTAVMLHMAKAAADSGKTVNVFSLEMTNAEITQRFMSSESDDLNQWRMARGDVDWNVFEHVSGRMSAKPIYLNDSARTLEDIRSHITLNSMSGRCDVAFIDYLGLIKLNAKSNLSQAIAECTSDLKNLAKTCRIPIVLLCQLNRASASEKRPPEMYDLRDSGGIEQDADIVLMLERATDDEDGKEVNMWVRKNRQGKAGNVNITIVANDTFSAFTEKDAIQHSGNTDDFDNDDIPF